MILRIKACLVVKSSNHLILLEPFLINHTKLVNTDRIITWITKSLIIYLSQIVAYYNLII